MTDIHYDWLENLIDLQTISCDLIVRIPKLSSSDSLNNKVTT
jgi:hypothetical protein